MTLSGFGEAETSMEKWVLYVTFDKNRRNPMSSAHCLSAVRIMIGLINRVHFAEAINQRNI